MPSNSDLRRSLLALTKLAARDVDSLLKRVDSAERAREALRDVLPALVDTYGAAAATIAADWYDERRLEAGAKGRFEAVPASTSGRGALELAGYGSGPLFRPEPDRRLALSYIAGGLDRRIFDVGRETVMESAIADPAARGWQRETDGDACGFCEMLAGRGSVYSESSVDFASHDFCGCVAVPAFEGEPIPVKPYTPSLRRLSPEQRTAERRRVNTWIEANL